MHEAMSINMNDASYLMESAEVLRCKDLCQRLDMLEPGSPETRPLLDELFEERLPRTSEVILPIRIDRANRIDVGQNVLINHSFMAMAVGGIEIEDGVTIDPDVSIITYLRSPKNRDVLEARPVRICRDAIVGASSVIYPGVTIGVGSVVQPGSVVTGDVEAYSTVAGNPAVAIGA